MGRQYPGLADPTGRGRGGAGHPRPCPRPRSRMRHSMSTTTQTAFAEALLDRAKPVPEGLRSWTGSEPRKRYGVYRNNVATGLTRALAARFPVTEKIVGQEFFTAMARDFVLCNPPSSPVLLHYGEDFADFVSGFAPAASLPYLADIV